VSGETIIYLAVYSAACCVITGSRGGCAWRFKVMAADSESTWLDLILIPELS
jgi:hypothetical protein